MFSSLPLFSTTYCGFHGDCTHFRGEMLHPQGFQFWHCGLFQ